jgi:serine/threonine-protein kinase
MLGRFELEGELGRGAMGAVWRAVDPLIGRPVAIKVVDASHFALEPEARELFQREARAAGRLSHPNIVTIYDAGFDGEDAYLVMELINGRTLRELIAGGDPLPAFTIADLGAQIAEALDYAHSHGVVHRDIKPANIMLTSAGLAKITDFGVARLEDTARTRTGVVRGSPRYMSPEQVCGAEIDGRSDLFSLGLVLYEVVTGRPAFGAAEGGDLVGLMKEIVNAEPTPPSQINRYAPKAFDTIISRALRKNPAERYARGADLVNDLRHYKALTRSLDPDYGVTVVLPAGAVSAPASAVPRAADRADADEVGLLAELRQRAEVSTPPRTEQAPPGASSRELHARMRDALEYLQEFAHCVGVLKPEIPREYVFVTETFRGLAVTDAFTTYRSAGSGAGAPLHSIRLTVECTAPQQFRFERHAASVKPFAQYLAEYGLRYTLAKVRNERRELVGGVFRVLGDIRIDVELTLDAAEGIIRIAARNLEGFGASAFRVPARRLDRALLEELGWLVLGRPSTFGMLAEREAGTPVR